MVLARFLPRDEQFFDHFRDAATNAPEVIAVLIKVVDNGVDRERDVRLLRDLEHRCDEITHRIFSALNSTFVTPLDREDIRDLAVEFDDLVDDAEEAGKRLSLYRLADTTEPARLLARILHEQTQGLAIAVPLLANVGKHGEAIRRHWVILAAGAMGLGTAMGGWRIVRTMGLRVVDLRPIDGFAAETAAATVIEVASRLGIPVSTTQVISSSILGVGATRSLSAVRWGIAGRIVSAWVVTIPASIGPAWVIYGVLHLITGKP